ncbi:hypothetical protein A3K29_05510 [Candidatus Collierbacteria bacterium RIFOXYB2_FULL_46_14]|uniref:Uncharacterized protein n=1 Tax=Candidatus Collierbacteria bacterium GW2011_GWA2_46_26 TaxID=1618381 RepID=A0A0G1PKM4_9BACT|nr:MAG: hypothetical protein UX47_C0004G0014 [Candidatus Collierbacteria bacterium GW2011_GWA2_46_26]OGD73548.1 MAG: hypothetical protein A3K29_05510 [Candidatus Collierbacteria bacterium RIFOXYB2_FULL_46_14]OGD76590.1 MAG: hypothetical protein A3K43_05510 [Candidatus Collierbacteria bacterium RIFOXYA2_FULL_46_20]OGD77926.1 MAG: hypothetical protein A3K39_05510 [Candidatus Collierbacteria bacterium RIFOXYC2_FULL_43_15]OGD81217.1 MAG: hypothetical protein A2320_06010 [Pseudomonadales bacterium G
MFECRYCGNVFEKLTDVGACPACGGPKPKCLQPEVLTMIVDRYVYMPATSRSPEYYTPPQRTLKQQAYSTLGYKLVVGFTALAVTAFVAWFAYLWFFYDLGAPKDADPSFRDYIPTSVASPTTYVIENPWSNTIWLSSSEALALRTQEQVIHLAYLSRGEAKYTNQSAIFDANSWSRTTPLGVSQLSTSGTGVTITVNGSEYHLNILQPFVIANQPQTIFIVDLTGQIWSVGVASANLVDLQTAQSRLTVTITPNGDLSLTY